MPFWEALVTITRKQFLQSVAALALSGADPMVRAPERAQVMFKKAIPEWGQHVGDAKVPQT
jgi:hypothetical protein